MKHRVFFVAVLSVIVLGCAYQVPLMRELALKEPPDPKYDKSIVPVMSAEQARQVIEYSPQFGDTYVFEGGAALKDLSMNIFGQLYREVRYTETVSGVGDCDLAVEASLRNYEIYMSFRQGNTVRLGIDYTIFDSQGNIVEELSTNSSSQEPYRGGERVTALLVGAFYNIGKMKEKVGAAWDNAAVNSIGELLDTLLAMDTP